MGYVLRGGLEMEAGVKRLTLLWTNMHFVLHLGTCTHTPLQTPFGGLLHSFCSWQLQILWPGSFLYWHDPKLLEKMLQKDWLLSLYKPAISLWLTGHLKKTMFQKQEPLSENLHTEKWNYLCFHIVVNFIFTVNWNSRWSLTCILRKLGENSCDFWDS